MASLPTQTAKVILTFIAPCYHNFVFIIETAEMAQYLNYIFIILPCDTVIFFFYLQIATNNSIVGEIEIF